MDDAMDDAIEDDAVEGDAVGDGAVTKPWKIEQ